MVSSRRRLLVWWFRAGIGIRLFFFFLISFLLFLLVYWQRPTGDAANLPSVVVWSLVNFIVAALLILVFLVARNFYQLLFERKRKTHGSRLRLKLVGAIVGLTAIPAVLLISVSSGLLSKAIDGWFSSPVEASVEAAREVAKMYFGSLKSRAVQITRELSEELQSQELALDTPESIRSLLERKRVNEELYGIQLFSSPNESVVHVENVTASIDYFSPPPLDVEIVKRAFDGNKEVIFQETLSSQFVRSLRPVLISNKNLVLLVTIRVPASMTLALNTIGDSYNDYLQLQHFQNPLRSTYIVSLYLVAALVLFAAVWLGIHIARQLTVPIQRLSEAMQEVASGNFGRQVHHKGDDEIALLTRSFNQMTTQLRDSTAQSERRRVYLETVLSNLAVGVVVFDIDGTITAVNDAALRILGEKGVSADYEGSLGGSLIPDEMWEKVGHLLTEEAVRQDPKRIQEQEVLFSVDGIERRVLCTTGALTTQMQRSIGNVLLIDDVTALSEAQRLAAWREAARRIAHEIKNPLTPIKLAAQRLGRTFRDSEPLGQQVLEATHTIIEHVDSIKRLTDEFSRFARMPMLNLQQTDLTLLVNDVVLSYVENERGISFQAMVGEGVPEVEVDAEQIRRMLINLIDNSIRAIREERDETAGLSGEAARVLVKLYVQQEQEKITLEICDTGPGVAVEDRARVFEPYFTRRSGGTGLGLAIVASIVAEHHGEVRVTDFSPRGTRMIISLPLSMQRSTQRKLEVI